MRSQRLCTVSLPKQPGSLGRAAFRSQAYSLFSPSQVCFGSWTAQASLQVSSASTSVALVALCQGSTNESCAKPIFAQEPSIIAGAPRHSCSARQLQRGEACITKLAKRSFAYFYTPVYQQATSRWRLGASRLMHQRENDIHRSVRALILSICQERALADCRSASPTHGSTRQSSGLLHTIPILHPHIGEPHSAPPSL